MHASVQCVRLVILPVMADPRMAVSSHPHLDANELSAPLEAGPEVTRVVYMGHGWRATGTNEWWTGLRNAALKTRRTAYSGPPTQKLDSQGYGAAVTHERCS